MMTAPKLTVNQKASKFVNNVNLKLENSRIFITLIIASALLFIVALFLGVLAGNPNIIKGIFKHGLANVTKEHPLNIIPADWGFAIWGVIYLFQLAWVIYSLGLICRQTPSGPAYLNPVVLTPAFFIFFIISSGFFIGWLFLWDEFMFVASFVFVTCICLSLFLCLAIVSSRLFTFKNTLIEQGRTCEVKFIQAVLINGLAMFVTWIAVATVVNLGLVFVYKWSDPISDEDASMICLGILAFAAVVYIALDLTVLEPYTRYTVTPYMVVVWSMAAILAKNYNPDHVSSIMAAVLLCAVALALVVKLGITCYRERSGQYHYSPMRLGH